MDQEVYLKNVTQVGTPGPSGKIYIADDAYERVHMDDYHEVRVFVLMGHTECSAGKYTTFIEAAITVDDITFIRNIPVWTNKVWNRIYMEIKRAYDNMIIVGWAMDQKGVTPAATHELESIHREHFGGVNQVLLLLDSEQQEERFYLSRNNHLYPKDGFYIYYSCGKAGEQRPRVQLEIPPETKMVRDHARNRAQAREWDSLSDSSVFRHEDTGLQQDGSDSVGREKSQGGSTRGQYRAMMEAQKHRRRNKSAGKFNAFAAIITVALIAGIVVTGIRKDPARAAQMDEWIETISNSVRGSAGDGETSDSEHMIYFTTESNTAYGEDELQPDSMTDTEAQQTSGDVIPLEEVDGGI